MFAQVDIALIALCVISFSIAAIYGCYCAYLMIYHPRTWSDWCQRDNERKMHTERLKAMQKMEEERQRQENRRVRGNVALGMGSALLRAFLR